ncbi:methylase involved in ubiquinone/menaquinone biosynthesis [Mycolicibacterium conceptionense]|uniref:Methylase involved in ubiquinone/menaquinone biosynthesis n=1 Tax=Mycolicibacterium conceptionense TaxID=451644 RepID=A0A0U1DU43_9MYCO|nr:methylase involved in ubiquinone/menaquinone biosynthesis [Mycolicibacterium conceptionense]
MSAARAINHHADHPGFAGVTGVLCGLVFLLVGRAKARMAADIAQLGPDDHVVDVGCGPGTAARIAARRGARATGVDPSSTMLRIARLVTPKRTPITWAEGTAESLPVADGSATVLWALATVHHWQDVEAAVAEARRVLTAGGRLIAIERQSPEEATGLAATLDPATGRGVRRVVPRRRIRRSFCGRTRQRQGSCLGGRRHATVARGSRACAQCRRRAVCRGADTHARGAARRSRAPANVPRMRAGRRRSAATP